MKQQPGLITALGRAPACCARMIAILTIAGGLSACAQNQTLYSWDSYQPMTYSYLTDESADYVTQAQAMEENIETARASNQSLPPGFRAHLGLLYLKTGDGAKAVELWHAEKHTFPESESFMDFLMRHINGESVQDPEPTAETSKEG